MSSSTLKPYPSAGSDQVTGSGSDQVIVLGLDGATFDVITPLVAQGKLPNLGRLMKDGVAATLQSTILPKSPQAWSSFMTGMNPGKHGIFGFSRLRRSSYEIQYVNDAMRSGESLWGILGRHGKRVGVINVPMTYPPEHVNGWLVGGMMSPGTHVEFTYPPHLYGALKKDLGEYIIEAELPKTLSDARFKERYLQELLKMVKNRGAAARYLYRKQAVDFLMVVFTATDRVSHAYWRYRDPTHPEYNAGDAARYGQAIDQVYMQIDEEIGKLLAEVGEDATVLVMSDHGMAALTQVVHLNAWLAQKGFLARRKGAGHAVMKLVKSLGKAAWRALRVQPHKLLTLLPPKLRAGVLGQISFSDIDWAHTRAFSLGYDGNLIINTRGERPQGIVSHGEEYEAVRDKLVAALYDLADPSTGERLVDHVYRREEIYSGPHVHEAPDLLIAWRGYRIRNVVSVGAEPRSLVSPYDAEVPLAHRHSSAHTLDGILIIKGPHIRRSSTLAGASIQDLAPTILHLFGLPVPSDMDGTVLRDIFTTDYLASHPITYEARETAEGESSDTNGGDEALVESRLKGLGYIG